MNEEFVSYFLQTMLNDYFISKRRMARKLGLRRKTIQNKYKRINDSKGASLVFERSICYCYEHGISVDAIYDKFVLKKKTTT